MTDQDDETAVSVFARRSGRLLPGSRLLSADGGYHFALALAVLSTAAILLWGLGAIPLLSLNEARRAVPLQEMVASGDWLLPTLNGQLYIAKPPLLYWLTATLATVSGSTAEWVVRLPSAVAALVTAWAVFATARRVFGRWPALFALLVLVANAGYAGFGRRGEIEMLLSALCACSLLALFRYLFMDGARRWLLGSYLLLGLAVLTKGPVALLFVVLPLLVYGLIARDRRALRASVYPWGWLVLVLVGSSWYLAVVAKLGLEPWRSVVAVDIVGKVSSDSGTPIYVYLVWLLGDFLLWSLLLVLTPRRTVLCWLRTREGRFLACAAWMPFLVLSLFDEKHAKYLLPAYPALAMLLGVRAADFYQRVKARWQPWVLAGSLAMVVGYVGYFSVVEARLYRYRFEALPRIAAYLQRFPEVPVYAFLNIDMRAVYYHGAPIPALTTDEAKARLNSGQPLLLLVRRKLTEPLLSQGWCELTAFAPYLGRDKEAVILGAGAMCVRGAS